MLQYITVKVVKKLAQLSIRVTQSDKDLIKEKAMKENRNVSSYIRSIFYEKIKKEKGVNKNGTKSNRNNYYGKWRCDEG